MINLDTIEECTFEKKDWKFKLIYFLMNEI